MGRKTFESLGRVLPNRKHIVLTQNKELKYADDMVEVISDVKDLDKYINSEEETFVIGGATIYKMLMPYTNKMYVTKIEEEFDADTFFPEIDENNWKVVERKKRNNRWKKSIQIWIHNIFKKIDRKNIKNLHNLIDNYVDKIKKLWYNKTKFQIGTKKYKQWEQRTGGKGYEN